MCSLLIMDPSLGWMMYGRPCGIIWGDKIENFANFMHAVESIGGLLRSIRLAVVKGFQCKGVSLICRNIPLRASTFFRQYLETPEP